MTPVVAWVDGALVERDQARISVDDFAARYGAACFETILARHGRPFRLAAHLDRLEGGLRAMRVTPPARDGLTAAIRATLEANALTEAPASIRLTVSAGAGRIPDLAAAASPAVVVTADPASTPASPARLRVASVRLDEHRPMREAKTANFLPYLLARAEAREEGADDALLLNHAGAVAEAATANLFALLDGVLVTPPLDDGPLPGVTRAALIEVAAACGLPVQEVTVTVDDLARAEAVLLTASVQGLRLVASIQGAPPASPSPIDWHASRPPPDAVARIVEAYESLVERECAPPVGPA